MSDKKLNTIYVIVQFESGGPQEAIDFGEFTQARFEAVRGLVTYECQVVVFDADGSFLRCAAGRCAPNTCIH